jgi:6-pyruvoyltetrahydropterin/6-carboxytetrahydropterin synthase
MSKPVFRSSKYYPHSRGLSIAYRNPNADSHCRLVHGYSIAVKLDFMGEPDKRDMVVDFGGLKTVKQMLDDTFDHKVLIREDDPFLEYFKDMQDLGLMDVVTVPMVGCEGWAFMIYEVVEQWLKDSGLQHIQLERVTVSEHESNSASYGGTN